MAHTFVHRAGRSPSNGRFRVCAHLGARRGADRLLAVDVTGESRGFVLLTRVRSRVADDHGVTARLLLDATTCARIDHPNVVRTLAAWEERDWVFVATEYLMGHCLAEILDAYRRAGLRMPASIACGVIADSLRGLGYGSAGAGRGAAWRGRPHGGVSASSIFVTYDGRVVLVDFGLSRVLCNASVTQTHQLGNWLGVRSSEVLRGQEVDERTDLRSLGIVLWEALTGRQLWQEESEVPPGIAASTIPSPPSRHVPELPNQLDSVVARALADGASAPCQSGYEFLAALAPWCLEDQARRRQELQRELRALFPERQEALHAALTELRGATRKSPLVSLSALPILVGTRPSRGMGLPAATDRVPSPHDEARRRVHACGRSAHLGGETDDAAQDRVPVTGVFALWRVLATIVGSRLAYTVGLAIGLLAALLLCGTCSSIRLSLVL